MTESFYTNRGYHLKNSDSLSESMEDYVEMIARMGGDNVGVNDLAKCLNVGPPSVSKMVRKLSNLGLVSGERYGKLKLTQSGEKLGGFLIKRHRALTNFFTLLNKTKDVLEQVEQVEHYIDKSTVENLEKLVETMKKWEKDLG